MSPSNQLKTAIRPVHDALEATPIMRDLTSPNLTPHSFGRILHWWYRHWAALETLEHQLRPANVNRRLIPVHRANKALPGMRLLNVGGNTLQSTQGAQPPGLAGNEGSWLGLTYLMRGSELGNAVLLKHLQQQFAATPAAEALSFFAPPETAVNWRTFKQTLDTRITQTRQLAPAITAAQTVFQWLLVQAEDAPLN